MTPPSAFASTLWPRLRRRMGGLLLWAMAAQGLAFDVLGTDHRPSPGAVVQTAHVRAELLAWAPEGVSPGQPLWLGLQLQHRRGWHTYWKNPGDSGLPTRFKWTLPAGLRAGDIEWPRPHQQRVGPLVNYGYEDTVLLPAPLQVSARSDAAVLNVQLHASWLVCERECVPEEGDFSLQLPTRSASVLQAASFQASLAQRPTPWPQAQVRARPLETELEITVQGLPTAWLGRSLDLFPETAELLQAGTDGQRQLRQHWSGSQWQARVPLSDLRSSSPDHFALVLTQGALGGVRLDVPVSGPWPALAVPIANPGLSATQATAPVQDTATGDLGAWGLALLGALAGGLILNLMPCVFPILSLKVLSLTRHGRDRRAQRLGALAYGLGVVLSFMALGLLMLSLRAAGEELGWGFQLQSPAFVVGLAILFALLSLNLAGLFEFGLFVPSSWAAAQWRHPALDAFFSGVLAVVVASPCTAPFMGASLGVAMSLPTGQALSFFAALGLGMALPYLVACSVPALVQRLPAPGPWMRVLRQFMAFPMMATVVWLAWILGQQNGLNAVAALLSLMVLLAWLLWSLGLVGRSRRLLASLALLALLGWGQWLGADLLKAPEPTGDLSPPATQGPAASGPGQWQPWRPNSVATLLDQGHPVFVDFTAAWCVTCQYNKKAVLSQPEVKAAFNAQGVQLLRADWTRRDPAITAALTRLGRNGVPVYVLYRPGHPPRVLSEILSVDAIREALNPDT